ncbi:oxidoreductase [Kitasatospora sp. NPDC056327]|uniref:oxidoreductase n=1 Tax=Kitasatospora sp. NPDC056327 TaxID=3345785 RepID=UPI0035DBDD18
MPTYQDLTGPEQRLWDACATGAEVDLRSGDPGEDDPVGGAAWGPGRTVRAEVITSALLGAGGDGPVRALRLTGARVTGRLDLGGLAATGELRLEGCHFEEQVVLRDATLRSTALVRCRIPGLDGWLLKVDGNLFFEDSVFDGRLTLTRAHITGELRLSGARITATELLGTGPRGAGAPAAGAPAAGPLESEAPDPAGAPGVWALWAGGLVMEGGCFARKGFHARGGLRLVGARFGGGLFMERARIDNAGGDALTGDDLTASTLVLADGFTANGSVRLPGAAIRSRLSFDGAVLNGGAAAPAAGSVALDGTRLTTGDLHLTPAAVPNGTVDLQDAQTAVLHDNAHSWPADTRLDGFAYTSLQGPPAGPEAVADRLAWLARLPGYSPQPYEQLAAWYRRIGHDDDARRVLLEKQRRRRRTLGPAGRVWGRLLDVTVGYGYRPWQALLWLAGLALLGTLVFRHGVPHEIKRGESVPFSPLVYTLDLLVPIGGLGQRTAWYWTGPQQWFGYSLTAIGWLLTTAVLAGISRTLNRS